MGEVNNASSRRKKVTKVEEVLAPFSFFDGRIFGLWASGLLFCFFPLVYGSVHDHRGFHGDHKDFYVSFAVCAAAALPLLMDGLMQRSIVFSTGTCIDGTLYYDSCRYKFMIGCLMSIPNLCILTNMTDPTFYLSFSQVQQFLFTLLIITNIHDVSFSRNNIAVFDPDAVNLLISLFSVTSCCQILHAVFETELCAYLAAISVGVYLAVLFVKSFVWFKDYFMDNLPHVLESSSETYEKRCLAYDVLTVSMYVLALLLYTVVCTVVGSMTAPFDFEAINAKMYCMAVFGIFIALVPDKSKQLKLKAMEDEYYNKRIFVQYVSQEAIYPLNSAIQGFQWLIEDASKREGDSLRSTNASSMPRFPAQSNEGREDLGLSTKLVEIRQHCVATKKCLSDLARFDKFDTGAVLGHPEDINIWKFVRAQVDYFSTQIYSKRVATRYFSRLNDNLPVEEDDKGISFMGGSYSISAPVVGLPNQSFDDIYIGDCVKTATCKANKHKLTQVFRHLINNALRFSPVGGEICVVVQLKERVEETISRGGTKKKHGPYIDDTPSSVQSEDHESVDDTRERYGKGSGHVLRVEIRDQGPGVDRAEISRLFSKRRKRDKDKGGIGLWLCQMIVEMHGGKIGYVDPRDDKVVAIPLLSRRVESSSFTRPSLFGATSTSTPQIVGAVGKIAEVVKERTAIKDKDEDGGAMFFVELPVHLLNPDHHEMSLQLFPRSAKVGVYSARDESELAAQQVAMSVESGSASASFPATVTQEQGARYIANSISTNNNSLQNPNSLVNKVTPPSNTTEPGALAMSLSGVEMPKAHSYSQLSGSASASMGNLSEQGHVTKVSDPIPIPW